MKHFLFALASLSFAINATENTLAPNGKITLNMPPMGNSNAFSFLGEFGAKLLRGSATYGVYINPCDRINFSGELLLEDLKYSFSDGIRKKWMSQYAVGAKYQHLFLYDFLESIEFAAAYAQSFMRTVRTAPQGRVAGSNDVIASFGPTFNVWDCGYFSPILNYDYVKYFRRYERKKVVSGFGGSVEFVQYFPLDFSLMFEADFRQPFFYYGGALNWHGDFSSCGLDVGAYANYTRGLQGLPNVLIAGLQLGLSFGPSAPSGKSRSEAPGPQSFTAKSETTEFSDLSSWISRPAIYMPIVLSIPDQKGN